MNLFFSLIILSLFIGICSCSKQIDSFRKNKMNDQLIENRKDLYKEAFGAVDNDDNEIE